MGLTGGFGAGKSTAARFFKRLGARVLDADRLAHEVYRKTNPAYPKIRPLFPERRGRLTRAEVGGIVFRHPKRRRLLESLIHPYVFRRIREEAACAKEPAVILEVPLLFETGFDRHCDVTVTVWARARKIRERLRRRGFSPAEVRARSRAQMPVAEKIRRADFTIDNSDNPESTRREVDRVWQRLKSFYFKKGRPVQKGASQNGSRQRQQYRKKRKRFFKTSDGGK